MSLLKRAGKRASSTEGSRGPAAAKADSAARGASNGLVGLELLFRDGVAYTGDGRFSKTLWLGDTNYQDELIATKEGVYLGLCDLHQYFVPGVIYQFNLTSRLERQVSAVRFLPEKGADSNLATLYNDELEHRQREGNRHIVRNKFITFSVTAKDDETARAKLTNIRDGVVRLLHRNELDVEVRDLDGMGLMGLLHELNRPDDPFDFEWEALRGARERAVDHVSPTCVLWNTGSPLSALLRDTAVIDGRHVQMFRVRAIGSRLDDRALSRIHSLAMPMNISLSFVPQPHGEITTRINGNIDVAQAEIMGYQKKLSKQHVDITLLPPSMQEKADEAAVLRDFIREKDQEICWFQGIITIWGDTPEELATNRELLISECRTFSIDLVPCQGVGPSAYTSSMPFAHPRDGMGSFYRSLATSEAAALVPFGHMAFDDDPRTSLLIGQATSTGTLNFVDPANLHSPHAWFMGMTGGGKSMTVKPLITWIMCQHPRTKFDAAAQIYRHDVSECPQIIGFDFHHEYVDTCKALGGRYTPISKFAGTTMNPLDILAEHGRLSQSDIAANIDFFTALFQNVCGHKLDSADINVLDRCLTVAFEPHFGKETRPVLADLLQALKDDESPRAEYLAEDLDIFVHGSMSCFNGQTSFEDDPCLQFYDCSTVGATMRRFAMLTMLQHVRHVVMRNFEAGRITYVIFEEVQAFFDDSACVALLNVYFSELRKFGLRFWCITQLPERVLEHDQAKYLFENSGMFVFLAQSERNRAIIADLFNLSPAQENAIRDSIDKGSGLLIADGVKVPFKNGWRSEVQDGSPSALYELWNTDPKKAKVELPSQAARRAEEVAEDDALDVFARSLRDADALKGVTKADWEVWSRVSTAISRRRDLGLPSEASEE